MQNFLKKFQIFLNESTLFEVEPYQKDVVSKHKRRKFRLIGLGGNKYKTKGVKRVSPRRSKSAPPMEEAKGEQALFLVKMRVRVQRDAMEKAEAENVIRSIDGVTVVSVAPTTAKESLNYFYTVFNIKFCCVPAVEISPETYVRKTLRGKINSMPGMVIERFIGQVRRLE